ncbi:hypothetical protein CONPUDRAFT_78771 [Coniophora puteana RWD-64-598 SS2]|uniref:BZIP domain-containing protein n=1 Tax=Coniophora puteana (strain RWD-64-598) TaxID=741705 RepID=A0A5M3N4Q8_CONPW|nr:uncharacterized protein CONPUDRAFT_78771 [Coniophora puteana RWD-64-598 SS2]EIW86410.1 hypothetical protein CONPUDRAFT_78771 [Coniophora puteana RWD-64-598 SS2]
MENSQDPRSSNTHLSGHSLLQGRHLPLPIHDSASRIADSLGSIPTYAPPSSGHISIPPEAYNYLMQALMSMQGSLPLPPSHGFPSNFPTAPPMNLPPPTSWSPSVSSISDQQQAPSRPYSPSQFLFNQSSLDQPSDCSSDLPLPLSRPTIGGHSGDLDAADDEVTAIAEDKRRRNTAASARFRIKKKQWTLNLERTVADLAGRAEELEREAADLRKENSWLKEIVLLRGKALNATSTIEGDNKVSSEPADARTDEDEESEDDEQQQGQPHKGEEGENKGVS